MHASSRSEEHVGEWKLTLSGSTLADIFAEAARVVAGSCDARRLGTPPARERVTLTARDQEALLADWINELLGLSEVRRAAFEDVEGLRIDGGSLEASVRGRQLEEWRSPIKAATYHGLRLARTDDGWSATVLLDV